MHVDPIYRRWLLVGYLILVLGLTLAPLPRDVIDFPSFDAMDKLVHLALFGGLACLLFWNRGSRNMIAAVVGSALIAAAAAGLIELLQDLVPYRAADAVDFLAGGLGAVVAVLVLGVWSVARRGKTGSDQSGVAGSP